MPSIHAFDCAKHRNIGAEVVVETRAGRRAGRLRPFVCRKGCNQIQVSDLQVSDLISDVSLTKPPDARVLRKEDAMWKCGGGTPIVAPL
jgi:hypothetical protein